MKDRSGWVDAVRELRGTLETIDRTERDGIAQAMFAIWRTLARAPTPFQKLYERIPEDELLEHAHQLTRALKDPGFGFTPSFQDRRSLIRSVGAQLRALEELNAVVGLGEIASDPAKEWTVKFGDEKAYLVPLERPLWRLAPDPALDLRPFNQRGLQKHRVIPAKVDGADVVLKRLAWLGTKAPLLRFGAALFPRLRFTCEEDQMSFLVTGIRCTKLHEVIENAVRETHQSGCMATLFPELTIDDDARALIERLLQEKPWIDEESEDNPGAEARPRTPALVVAGSWHRPTPDGHANIATVLDGDGNLLLEQAKRLPFVDEKNLEERIVSGEELAVLVLDGCLIAFGICLDFCNRRQKSVYDDLDVDLVLVPSCGNDSTMKGHISNAETLLIRRKTRTMVVQQAYPKRRGGIGYVLPPTTKIAPRPSKLVEKRRWSIVST